MKPSALPLVVDLDGTLINTDLFFESAIWYIRKNPFRFFQMCWWFLIQGRAELKLQIEKRVNLSVSDLPFNSNTVNWLRDQKKKGRKLVLVTGASQKYAEQVAEHLSLFSDVFGVCRQRPRLTGRNKAQFLLKLYGEKKFDYIGNSIIDLAVWSKAGTCIIANALPIVIRIVEKKISQTQILSESFSISQYLNVFKKFFFVLFLRIFIFMVPVFFAKDSFFNFILMLPGIVLFYITAFLLGQWQELGPHRKLQSKGVFSVIHPYWGLFSIPLGVCALIFIFRMHELFYFLGFFVYFVLEYMRWAFGKYSFHFDVFLTVFLPAYGFLLLFR